MTSPKAGPAWERLGGLLVARRLELDPKYRYRTKWCEDTGLNYRLVVDLENGLRPNYTDPTLAAVERAYQWEPGSIKAVLDGGDPEPAVLWDHPHDQQIWELHEIPEAQRRLMIRVLQADREREDRNGPDIQGNRRIS